MKFNFNKTSHKLSKVEQDFNILFGCLNKAIYNWVTKQVENNPRRGDGGSLCRSGTRVDQNKPPQSACRHL